MKKLINLLLVALLSMTMAADTFFKAGTKWVSYHYPAGPKEDENSRTATSLEQIAASGEYSLGLYDSYTRDVETTPFSEPQLIAFVKVEGNKVYFKPLRPNANEWLLMYDFDLTPGEGAYHYYAGGIGYPGNPDPERTYLKCVGIDVDPNYPGWELMSLEEYRDDTCEVLLEGGSIGSIGNKYWIKGLSSRRDVTWNSGVGLVGGGATLLEVTCGDKIIYKHHTAAIQEVPDNAPVKIRINGLVLTVSDVSASNSLSVYSPSGQLIHQAPSLLSSVPTTVQLPHKGVYLLKIGQATYKVKAS